MRYAATHALLPGGWSERVVIDVDDAGVIRSVERGNEAFDERLTGPVVPAMPNVHSHAFQRALAGRTGRPSPDRNDSFWSWREAMYASLERLDPDEFQRGFLGWIEALHEATERQVIAIDGCDECGANP